MLTLLKVINSLPHKASHFHGSFSIRWTDCSHSFVSVPTERVREGEKHEIYAAAFSGHLFTGHNEVVVKVMFYLCLWFCPEGAVLSQHALQVASQHALQPVSGGCLVQGGACSWGVLGRGGCLLLGGAWSRGCLLVWPSGMPPQMATVADDMHPTGMHSCLWLIFAGQGGAMAPSLPRSTTDYIQNNILC